MKTSLLSSLLLLTLVACSKPQTQPVIVQAPPQRIEIVMPKDSVTAEANKLKAVPVTMPETLAVVDIRVAYNADLSKYSVDTKSVDQNIGEQIQGAFLRCGKYKLVERIRNGALKHELMENDTDWYNSKQINDFGRFVGAKYLARVTSEVIVTPSIFGFTSNVKTKVFIFNTESGIAIEDFEVESKAGSYDIVKAVYRSVDKIKPGLINEIRGTN